MALVLLALFRYRARVGITPLYLAVGAMQYLQVVFALSVYVELAPGLLVSPGSVVLFPATLFVVLLVYIREGVAKARLLIFGLVVANLVSVIVSRFGGLHLSSPLARNFYDVPAELFVHDLRVMVIGSLLLALDSIVLVVLYEALARVVRRHFFPRAALALSLVLALDSVLFVASVFGGRQELGGLLVSNLAGKIPAGVFYAAILTLYLLLLRRRVLSRELTRAERHEVFEVLTYRQRYERLREQLHRDPLTELYNRAFFQDFLALSLARSRRSNQVGTLALLDLDRFKQINDGLGHLVGDRVLKVVGEVLAAALRESDAACRIGGEEFALVLPLTGRDTAQACLERVRRDLGARQAEDPQLADVPAITFTAGLVEFPLEAEDPEKLFAIADRRLYAGKRAGRDRIVAE